MNPLSGSSVAVAAPVISLLFGCALEPRPTASVDLELALRIAGESRNGELGFRFGPPRDVDGDGITDVVAGARFTDLEFTQMGTVTVWSSDGGRELAHWEGHAADALFGHAALAGPDVDRDGLPDVVATAPNGRYHDVQRGVLYARSPVTGRLLWSVVGEPDEGLGWDLALAGDQNRDGVEDLFVGAPGGRAGGKAYLISGADGSSLREYVSRSPEDQFGWYVSRAADLDGDGLGDLLVGAPATGRDGQPWVGAAYLFSSATGRRLHVWYGRHAEGHFGEVVAALPDLDGDGVGDVAVSASHRSSRPGRERLPGDVYVFSGASGEELHHWAGDQPGERYGRMVASAGDVDGDGVADVAIGAPWRRAGALEKAGRFEVRSGRTGELLASVDGSRPGMWLGWHIEAADDLGRERARGLVVSAIRSEEKGIVGAGAIHIYIVRP